MRVTGIVVAAGRGDRFGAAIPKQFLAVEGETLVARAIRALSSRPGVDGVVAVLPPDVEAGVAREVRALPGVSLVVAGGATRAASVRRGLEAAGDATHVLVHDAARPLAGAALIDAVLAATLEHGAAVPAVAVRDTVKEDDGRGFVNRTVERSRLRLAQTPQGARSDWLRDALDGAFRDGVEVTDEASALERAGRKVRLVPGDPSNVKVTTPADLAEVRRALQGPGSGLRVGTGFDVHRFSADRPLFLGGVLFPGEAGLAGHSDADVVLHAAMDALLGAASLGDIGQHFPPGDPRFAGASSAALAWDVAAKIAAAGFGIVNLDVTLLAEKPRIRDRAEDMRRAVAVSLGIDPGRVGVKATTLEGLGALGRAEGIACQAVALLSAAESGR